MKDEKNRNVFTEDQKPLYGILQWKKLAGNDDAFNLVSAWFSLAFDRHGCLSVRKVS
ncbi:hypothetical protein [Solobacterium moorei]|uniref:hypothetical protein n=1 Tax=Solobacterium moorei TaxID=102148 RepID=UPI0023F12771|nr:hypothetical protein [Solobacterium moorei]